MCGIKNYVTHVKLVNVIFEDNLLGKNVKQHEKKHIIVTVSFDCDPRIAQTFECQIRTPRRKTLWVASGTKNSDAVKGKSQLSLYYLYTFHLVSS